MLLPSSSTDLRTESTTATVFVPDCLRTDSAIAGMPSTNRGGLGVFFGVVGAILEASARAWDHDVRGDANRMRVRLVNDDLADVLRIEAARPSMRSVFSVGPVSIYPPGC